MTKRFTEVKMGVIFVSAIALSTIVLKSPADAASFNCRYAKSSDEVLICQDASLSALDEQMSTAYFSRRKEFYGADLRRFERMRQQWLSRRKSCGYNAGCIRRTYNGWIAAIENFY